jgi:hypothetical protein
MKKIVSLGLTTALLFAVIALHPHTVANAQSVGLVSSILSRMERNRRNLKSLVSNISMEKWNSQLRENETKYHGRLKYIPGASRNASSLFLEWNETHEILWVADGAYTLYRPRLKQAMYGKTQAVHGKDNDVLELMSMSATQLRTRFSEFQDIRQETLWGDVDTWHFKVEPKDPASYKYIELWVDSEGMPVQTKMVEKNDDATTVRLTDLQRNVQIPRSDFNPQLDPSVKKIKG